MGLKLIRVSKTWCPYSMVHFYNTILLRMVWYIDCTDLFQYSSRWSGGHWRELLLTSWLGSPGERTPSPGHWPSLQDRKARVSAWWCHQMETFSALLAICAGNSPVTGEFPTQRSVTRSLNVFFDLRLAKWLSWQWWGWWFETPSCPLWRHRNGIWELVSEWWNGYMWVSGWVSALNFSTNQIHQSQNRYHSFDPDGGRSFSNKAILKMYINNSYVWKHWKATWDL